MTLRSDLLATYTSFYRFENTLHLGCNGTIEQAAQGSVRCLRWDMIHHIKFTIHCLQCVL